MQRANYENLPLKTEDSPVFLNRVYPAPARRPRIADDTNDSDREQVVKEILT